MSNEKKLAFPRRTRGQKSLSIHERLRGIPCRENFYDSDITSYERALTDLRRALMEKGCPQAPSCNTGTSIARENFARGQFVAGRVFIFAGHRAQEYGLDAMR